MHVSFIGVGAQKCASSWVHDILADHPEVVVASTKELDFFSYRFENGFRWYEQQFESRRGATIAGEISPSYLHEPAAPERAYAYASTMKIIVSLRDPVERALSQHRHLVRLGLVPRSDLSFESALATNPTYTDQGLYHRHLHHWMSRFGRSAVHVTLMEDIRADAATVARDLYRFLGISDDHQSASLHAISNPSYVPRNRAMDSGVGQVRRALEAIGAGRAWRILGNTGLRNLYRSANRQASAAVIPPPRPETLQHLRAVFSDDVERLGQLLQRDLSKWMPA